MPSSARLYHARFQELFKPSTGGGDSARYTVRFFRYHGTGCPDPALGSPGDVFIDEAAKAGYGKTNEGWMRWSGPNGAHIEHPTEKGRGLYPGTALKGLIWSTAEGEARFDHDHPNLANATATTIIAKILKNSPSCENRRDPGRARPRNSSNNVVISRDSGRRKGSSHNSANNKSRKRRSSMGDILRQRNARVSSSATATVGSTDIDLFNKLDVLQSSSSTRTTPARDRPGPKQPAQRADHRANSPMVIDMTGDDSDGSEEFKALLDTHGVLRHYESLKNQNLGSAKLLRRFNGYGSLPKLEKMFEDTFPNINVFDRNLLAKILHEGRL